MSSGVHCPPATQDYDRGLAFIVVDWIAVGVSTIALFLRVYSRGFLTRSFGSDDVMIIFGQATVITGTVFDTVASKFGYGRHCVFLEQKAILDAKKWLYLAWLMAFLAFFFVRASVMLFTLRLLPRTKRRSQWIIIGAFTLNVAITLIAMISFGLQCEPFSAIWNPRPGAKCAAPQVLTVSNRVNGVLACIIDITTACIPAFLLWKVQMKRKTKIVLDAIFALGLVTAALSIGRAATITDDTLTNDMTWRMIVPLYFSLWESKCGVAVACGPALRQFFSYYHRTGTLLPSAQPRTPNSDFDKMRHRVNVRDWFWRGKRDPMRAQGLINAQRNETGSESSMNRFGHTDPESSPLSELEQRVVTTVSQV